jgi:hypothetical protein
MQIIKWAKRACEKRPVPTERILWVICIKAITYREAGQYFTPEQVDKLIAVLTGTRQTTMMARTHGAQVSLLAALA